MTPPFLPSFVHLSFRPQPAAWRQREVVAAPGNGTTWIKAAAATLGLLAIASSLGAESVYPVRPDDPRAVELSKEAFGAHADGAGDDADALQRAIDRVAETTHAGVVFVPDGRYRLGKTVYVWQGIRLIGYGAKRPVFVLGRDTPGFQEGSGRYMIHFADNRPEKGGPFVDASEFTFYSGMSNIDFELQAGNPAAIAVRFHVAQHCALTHMEFRVGSARAAVEDIGNQASDIHVHGGEYGIITKRTAPVWQFLLMDSSFEGQRRAAIHTQEAGFTLVRVRFADMPVALQIAPGEVEQLYGRDLQLTNVSEAALVAGNAHNPHSEIALTNIACSGVPRFFGGDEAVMAPGEHYVVENFSLGLEIDTDGRERGIRLRHREHPVKAPAPAVASDIPALPPMTEWANVHLLGVKGDGASDDTAALQKAIDEHRTLFLPSGSYLVRAPLQLKTDTVLIGLNPGTTRIVLADGVPAFGGGGEPVGVLTAPAGGRNVVSAIGIATGVENPRAAGIVWMAGRDSFMDDVSFPGLGMPGRRRDGVDRRGTQAVDLLITNGGGGIFRGNWPHGTTGKVGLRIEHTKTPGKIYQMSVEHHDRVECEFHDVIGWEIYDLQTEEENPAGAEAYAADLEDAHDLLFANTYLYRVSRNVLPKTHGIIARRSDEIRFENMKVFSQTRLAYDNAVFEEGRGVRVRSQFFTRFALERGMKAPAEAARPETIFARDARLEKLAEGFGNASSLTATDEGVVFFTDAANHKVFRWNAAERKAELWAEISGQPQVLGFVPPDKLLAVTNEKEVYGLNTSKPGQVQKVEASAERLAGTKLLLPVGLHNPLWVLKDLLEHRGYVYRRFSNTAVIRAVPDEPRGYFHAPGSTVAIVTGGTWRPYLQSSQLAAYAPGAMHYVTSEDDGRTYSGRLDDDRTLVTRVFVEEGGTSVVTDAEGRVYLASGQVRIYDREGKEIGVLDVPERPGSLAFGGDDRRTLFVGARSSLYAIRTQAAGR